MKNILFTCAMCIIAISAFSQEKSKITINRDTTKNVVKENNISTNNQVTSNASVSNKSNEEIRTEINQIDSHVKSIEIKMEYVLKDPEQKSIAEKEGWFEDMKATKGRLETKKQNLLILLEN